MLRSTVLFLLVVSTYCRYSFEVNDDYSGEKDVDDSKNWWKKATIYHIYPRSFKDSDGDGVGDLFGIQSKLDYLKYIGVSAVWLSPIYESPMKDFGYDIANYTKIDKLFGTMEDFDNLVASLKGKGLRIVMDFVPNHTSNSSVWFEKSVNREDPFTDYYVWVDGKGENKAEVPNNWLGMFGGSAWEWNEKRKQFYYHQFAIEQPDLNHRSLKVREELKEVLRFWLKKGVDGFRIDAVKHLFEDTKLRDEPLSYDPTAKDDEYNSLIHKYTTSDPQVLIEMYEWRDVLDEFEGKDGEHRVMMVEINETVANTVAYYGNDSKPLADIPFNFELFKISKTSSVQDIYSYIKGWLDGVPKSKTPNWIISNHDQPRIANRTDGRLLDAFNMINLLLGGLALTYYGEEIGMVDTFVTWEQTRDPWGLYYGSERYTKFSRDPERSPMQWSAKTNAGFTTGTSTWLPINTNYKTINVESEKKDRRSHLSTYLRLQKMRKTKTSREGDVQFPLVTDSVLGFSRAKDDKGFVVVINFSDDDETVDLTGKTRVKGYKFPEKGKVGAFSDGISDDSALTKVGKEVWLNRIELPPKQAVAIWFEPKRGEHFEESRQDGRKLNEKGKEDEESINEGIFVF